jgi:uncharacterized protein Veg
MAESVVMVEVPHSDFITDQCLERHIRVRSFTYDKVCTEMAESVVMVEVPHSDFIIDQHLERHIRVRSFTYDKVCAATHGFEVGHFLA